LTAGLDLRAYGSYARRGKIYWDVANSLESESKDVVNLRLFLEAERWELGAYADNLTDERYPTQALADPFGPDLNARVASAKRQYGVQATFRF
jgi:outer membrane receptor protein involved in Fe transport